ncbi:unnamed protein product [Prunus brigantina]
MCRRFCQRIQGFLFKQKPKPISEVLGFTLKKPSSGKSESSTGFFIFKHSSGTQVPTVQE